MVCYLFCRSTIKSTEQCYMFSDILRDVNEDAHLICLEGFLEPFIFFTCREAFTHVHSPHWADIKETHGLIHVFDYIYFHMSP